MAKAKTTKAKATKEPRATKTKSGDVTIRIPRSVFITVKCIWCPFKVAGRIIGWPMKKVVQRHVKRYIAEMNAEMENIKKK